MEWAKTPLVAGSLTCAACLAVATALPAAAPVADHLTKTVQAGVNLSVNWDALDAFSAIQPLLDAFNGDPGALLSLGTVDGIQAFLDFAESGDLAAFEPNADGEGGYAALSGLNSLIGDGDISGIDAFSALGATGPGDLDSVSAIPAFQEFAATGNTDAFIQTKTHPGYAALSALSSYRDGDLSGIDAFSGPSLYATAFDSSQDLAHRADAIRGLAAFSAIPEYLGLPTVPPPPAPPTPPVQPLIQQRLLTVQPEIQTEEIQTEQLSAPADGGTGPVLKKGPAAKQPEVKKSLSFKPTIIPLFGSGGGKNAADNGIRGWGDMLKKAGLNGGETGGAPAGDPKGADGPS